MTKHRLTIAVASGKGGTGKTTVGTNLAWVAAQDDDGAVAYIDCDVEEPNGHLFLRPVIQDRRVVTRPVMVVDPARCTVCGRCESVCQFSAIVRIGGKVLTYPQLCHSCGACLLVCQQHALTETPEEVGLIEIGSAGPLGFVHGVLNVGQAKATGLIRATQLAGRDARLTIIDAPPGTSCPVVQTLRAADRVLLVTEPTVFGLHDLKLIVRLAQSMGLPTAIVVNRCDLADAEPLRAYCREQCLPILGEIHEDPAIARAYSRGLLASQEHPRFRKVFEDLLAQVNDWAGVDRLVPAATGSNDGARA